VRRDLPNESAVNDPIERIAKSICARVTRSTPFLIGIGGGVASGKSTFAAKLASELDRERLAAQVISLDGYLKPNAVLQAAGLMHRKGFPESFDFARLTCDVEAMRAGQAVQVPVYDHAANDVVAAPVTVAAGGVLILEGVIALAPELSGRLHFKVFLDTDLDVARARYLERVQRVAALDPAHPLNAVPAEHRLRVLDTVWIEVNVKNFNEHIAPTKESADIVVPF
jgi:type I pantothenate kinase